MPNRLLTSRFPLNQINDRPIVTILDELSAEELSRIALDVVRENRRRVDEAQSLFEQLERPDTADTSDTDLPHAYRLALVELKTYHELVRLVVNALGYVPEVPPESELH